jgi:cyclopropane fatty-acyl-phospholipid synthase-like methyltransferase
VGAKVMLKTYEETISLNVEELIEEYEYAQSEYKKSIGDQQRDYWDGYLAAIEKLFGEVVIHEL